jgi:dihydrofolate synthase/folylpolyglutamate synthase
MRRTPPRSTDPPSALPPHLSFVLGLSPSVMTLGLANMRRLLDHLGHPEKEFPSIVIAGTNGKGSVSAFVAAILQANGKRVGWYTSPHIFDVTERICVDGEPVPLDAMEEAASRIAPLHTEIGFSYFEALTAIAFQIFAARKIDIAVLEVGLGGRFDATNVVEPVLSILTGVALDHRRILGDSLEEILREKLGIARPGVPLLCGRLSPALRSVVEDKTARDGIPLCPLEKIGSAGLVEMSLDGMRARLRSETADYGEIRLPFIGEPQLGNALVSVRAAELVLGRVERLAEAAGMVRLRGRFEVVRAGGKTLVFDVAHNDEALIATLGTLVSLSPRDDNAIILGVMRRKELREFPAVLAVRVRRAYLIEPVTEEAYTGPELLQTLGVKNIRDTGIDASVERYFADDREWSRFIARVLSAENPCRVVLVTGSHRTVEAVGRHVPVMRDA